MFGRVSFRSAHEERELHPGGDEIDPEGGPSMEKRLNLEEFKGTMGRYVTYLLILLPALVLLLAACGGGGGGGGGT